VDDLSAIQKFLTTDPGQFCDDCLCGLLGIPSDEVKTAIFVRARGFVRVYGYCKACRQPRVVTGKLLAA